MAWPDNHGVRIVFAHAPRGGSVATIFRNDGVVVELPSFSRKHRVPHDLAHAVAEREFGLADGVFGSIAAGAMFDNMRVLTGRPRHDAVARSRRVLAANRWALTVAELMAGVLHRAVEEDAEVGVTETARHDWGIVSQETFPWTDDQVIAAVGVLRDLAEQWAALACGEGLEFHWPDRLIASVPPPGTSHRRSGRRGTSG
jgi:hypothetical protein